MNGKIAVGWLVVEDLAMVLVLVLLPPLAGALGGKGPDGGGNLWLTLGITLLKVSAFVALMLVVGRRVFPNWSVGENLAVDFDHEFEQWGAARLQEVRAAGVFDCCSRPTMDDAQGVERSISRVDARQGDPVIPGKLPGNVRECGVCHVACARSKLKVLCSNDNLPRHVFV